MPSDELVVDDVPMWACPEPGCTYQVDGTIDEPYGDGVCVRHPLTALRPA